MLKGMFGKLKEQRPDDFQEPAAPLTGAQRLIAKLGANSAMVAAKKSRDATSGATALHGPSGLLRLAGTMRKVRAAAPPPPVVDRSQTAVQNRLRRHVKKVTLAGALGVPANEVDATVHDAHVEPEVMPCSQCIGNPRVWHSECKVSRPKRACSQHI
eukprot:SAG31_NODE_213_length_20124_cov_17.709613_4_plen_157_part_00